MVVISLIINNSLLFHSYEYRFMIWYVKIHMDDWPHRQLSTWMFVQINSEKHQAFLIFRSSITIAFDKNKLVLLLSFYGLSLTT